MNLPLPLEYAVKKTEPGAEAPAPNVRLPQLPLRALFGSLAKPKDPELPLRALLSPLRALLTPPNVLHTLFRGDGHWVYSRTARKVWWSRRISTDAPA